MPSTRRVKILTTALIIAILTIIYLSRDSASPDFYARTVAALDKKEASDAEISRKLQEVKNAAKNEGPVIAPPLQKPLADSQAKPRADVDAPYKSKAVDEPSESGASSTELVKTAVIDKGTGNERSVAGRKTMKGGELKDVHSGKEAPMKMEKQRNIGEIKTAEMKVEKSPEELEVDSELNSILKKGPIIIFSKSYCPHSKTAKSILLDKYIIVPAPYVVELDQHDLGPRLQAALAQSTGRRTVPNVLINGKSIGGGDDVVALDNGGTLVEKVRSMGGKRIMEAKLRE